jgi:hypothetical protein
MLAKGKNAEEVAELTGLSLEKVNSLRIKTFLTSQKICDQIASF